MLKSYIKCTVVDMVIHKFQIVILQILLILFSKILCNINIYYKIKKFVLLEIMIPYTFISDNNYINDKFGIHADNKLYSYALWLEIVNRRIRHIRTYCF